MEVRLGKYQLVDKLGAGPLGEVFRARDTPLGRPVVLKAYRTRAEPDGRFAPRFLQVAKAAVGLEHENVVPVIDCGIEEGRPYVTRELQESPLLKEVLADRAPLSLAQKLRIVLGTAKALQFAHEHGSVHRDLKPSNIAVLDDFGVKVFDFGQAQMEDEELSDLIQRGAFAGQLAYLSPEQLDGAPLTPATDVFSFGAVLYEVFTGRRLFDGSSDAAVRSAISGATARRPNFEGVPEGLRELLDECLKPRVEDRLENLDEIVVELGRVEALVAASAASAPSTPAKGKKRGKDEAPAKAKAKEPEEVGFRLDTARPPAKSPKSREAAVIAPTRSKVVSQTPVASRVSPSSGSGGARRSYVPANTGRGVGPFGRLFDSIMRMAIVLAVVIGLAAVGALAVATFRPEWLGEDEYSAALRDAGRVLRVLIGGALGEAPPATARSEPADAKPAPAAAATVTAAAHQPVPVDPTPETAPKGAAAVTKAVPTPVAAAPIEPPPVPAAVEPPPVPAAVEPPPVPAAVEPPPVPAAVEPPPAPAAVEAPAPTVAEEPSADEADVWIPGKPAFVELPEGVRLELAWVPSGHFKMGCPPGDQLCNGDEKPVHLVSLDGFWIGKTEVTQAQWKAVMGSNPSRPLGATFPVNNVSWSSAQEFLQQTGSELRLPTEAEWEYAARGGVDAASYAPLEEVAWHLENSGGGLHPVGQKKPNAYGLYDVLGNVWEWCDDRYDLYSSDAAVNPRNAEGSRLMSRGGAAERGARFSRVSGRNALESSTATPEMGFRVARSVTE